jgi:hypothetical protein
MAYLIDYGISKTSFYIINPGATLSIVDWSIINPANPTGLQEKLIEMFLEIKTKIADNRCHDSQSCI